jgi:hypothetical protein
MTEEQLDIVERMVKYQFYRSMRDLRKKIRDYFVARGWKDALKEFKLKQVDSGTVQIYFRTPNRLTVTSLVDEYIRRESET